MESYIEDQCRTFFVIHLHTWIIYWPRVITMFKFCFHHGWNFLVRLFSYTDRYNGHTALILNYFASFSLNFVSIRSQNLLYIAEWMLMSMPFVFLDVQTFKVYNVERLSKTDALAYTYPSSKQSDLHSFQSTSIFQLQNTIFFFSFRHSFPSQYLISSHT